MYVRDVGVVMKGGKIDIEEKIHKRIHMAGKHKCLSIERRGPPEDQGNGECTGVCMERPSENEFFCVWI